MNIFVLDEDPALAALYHNDRHVVKMILETAQILCTAHVMVDGDRVAQKRIGDVILRPTHMHHPCVVWARRSALNYEWLWQLGTELLKQYTLRYHGRQHKYEELYAKLKLKPMNIEHTAMRTARPLCMPTQYQTGSVVNAYRRYYFGEKQHLAQWTAPAKTPVWWSRMFDTVKGEVS